MNTLKGSALQKVWSQISTMMLSRTFVQTTLRRGGPSLTTTNNHVSLSSSTISSRGFSSSSGSLELPRITERRPNETGRGGRASDAGVKVAVFGATGFLGRYVCSGLGEFIIIHNVVWMDCIFMHVWGCVF